MPAEQGYQARERTPRRTTRRTTATPVRDVSPDVRNTRAASTAVEGTPGNKRPSRGVSRKADQAKNAMNNSALPEIQTRQSYAYGSSKTPLLPEQLHAGNTLTMKQVADRMDTAIHRAEQNLETRAAELDENRSSPYATNEKRQKARKSSKDPSPESETTEVQKKQRTAMWASSLENDQLEGIPEEEQEEEEEEEEEVESPETRRTEPSSFPSGIFDHSYQYERGARPPRKPPSIRENSTASRLHAALDQIIVWLGQARDFLSLTAQVVKQWTSRFFDGVLKSVSELPDSTILSVLVKTLFILALTGFTSYVFCFGYSRFLCTPGSSSRFAQKMEALCGQCQTTPTYLDFNASSHPDIPKLTFALRQIDNQIRNIETRLNSRLDNKISSLNSDIESLRHEQSTLVRQLEQVSNQPIQQISSSEVASPLIPRVNYFSPANGAIVHPYYTSPTREVPVAFPLRVLARMVGIRKYRLNGPVTALEPWQDVGDCWCAAASAPGQDSIRLGVGVREFIYPTELVIEHLPKDVSLMPETAPRRVELWADFGHLTPAEWRDLNIDAMTSVSDAATGPLGLTHALIASVEYDLAAQADHLQRFRLLVNQFGDTKYAARDYVVRVRSTYGGDYGCLYRIRLHGMPFEKHVDVSELRNADEDDDDIKGMSADEII